MVLLLPNGGPGDARRVPRASRVAARPHRRHCRPRGGGGGHAREGDPALRGGGDRRGVLLAGPAGRHGGQVRPAAERDGRQDLRPDPRRAVRRLRAAGAGGGPAAPVEPAGHRGGAGLRGAAVRHPRLRALGPPPRHARHHPPPVASRPRSAEPPPAPLDDRHRSGRRCRRPGSAGQEVGQHRGQGLRRLLGHVVAAVDRGDRARRRPTPARWPPARRTGRPCRPAPWPRRTAPGSRSAGRPAGPRRRPPGPGPARPGSPRTWRAPWPGRGWPAGSRRTPPRPSSSGRAAVPGVRVGVDHPFRRLRGLARGRTSATTGPRTGRRSGPAPRRSAPRRAPRAGSTRSGWSRAVPHGRRTQPRSWPTTAARGCPSASSSATTSPAIARLA